MQFRDLRLIEPLLRALVTEGYTVATPVQAEAIPPALEGRDVIGCAQTGTGKTAAFALPILQRLSRNPRPTTRTPQARCLVLCPTRELATQISDGFRAYGKHLDMRHVIIFGGVNQTPQVKLLRGGPDIIVATPGRLLDLMNQGHVDLRGIEVFVLDEADRMLDMGFIRDIRKVIAQLPAQRQTMLFSATMPQEIRELADTLLRNPAVVQVTPVSKTADGIDESVYFVEKSNKSQLLAHLVNALPMSRALVFTRTKHGADRVVRNLHSRGIKSEAIHGNKSQNARQRALENFRSNRIPVLVATDIASRGIDIDDVTHVVNYDLTHEPETYVHRIGRTARAGATGSAVSFCDREERPNLRAIERLIKRTIPVRTDHPEYTTTPPGHGHRPEHGESAERPAKAPMGRRDAQQQSRLNQPSNQEARQQPANQQSRQQQPSGQPSRQQQQHPQRAGAQSPKRNNQPTGRGVTHANAGGPRHPHQPKRQAGGGAPRRQRSR
jgi:ATP-dependent RNA helicase RhlE